MLYELIQSLTPSEKRYFKLFAQKHVIGEQNNYTVLFDLLNKQKIYNESQIATDYPGTPKHLASDKTHLFGLILRSMRAYHAEKQVDARLREWLQDADFLQRKLQYDACFKALGKVKKLAKKHDRFPMVLEVLDRERRLVKRFEAKKIQKELDRLRDERKEILGLMAEEFEYTDLYDRFAILIREWGRNRTPANQAVVKKTFNSPLLQNPPELRTFKSKLFYFQCHALYAQIIRDIPTYEIQLKSVREVWEAYPHEIRDDTFNYRNSLFNYLSSLHFLDKYEDIPELLETIRNSPSHSEEESAGVFFSATEYEIVLMLNKGLVKEAATKIPEWEKEWKIHTKKASPARELSLWNNFSLVFFFDEQMEDALKWQNKIIHEANTDTRQDLQNTARLWLLCIHFELGNFELYDYLHRSAYRYLQQRKALGDFEKTILKEMRRLFNTTDKAEQTKIFTEFHENLCQLEEQSIAGLAEMKFWTKARYLGKSLSEVIVEG